MFGTANSLNSMLVQLMVNGTATSGSSPNSDRSIFRIRGVTGAVSKHWSTFDIPYDGTWHHVVITITEEPIDAAIYVDGSLCSVTTSGSSTAVGNLNAFQFPCCSVLATPRAPSTCRSPVRSGPSRSTRTRSMPIKPRTFHHRLGMPPRWTRNWSWWTRPRSVAYNGKLFVMGSWGLDVGLDIYDINGSRTPTGWPVMTLRITTTGRC